MWNLHGEVRSLIEACREASLIDPLVPLIDPEARADVHVDVLEVSARCVVVALERLATVVVDERCPAPPV